MNTYLVLKTLHIISSVLLVGTGLGSAFYLFFANRSGSVAAQAVVGRLVVRADWWFTTPAVIVQPLTGIAMAHMAGWPITTPWLALSIALYLLASGWLVVSVQRGDETSRGWLLPASVAGLSAILVPVVAMLMGALAHGEPLGLVQWAAMACCALALRLALVPSKPGST